MPTPLETLATYVPSLVVRRLADDPAAILAPRSDRLSAAVFFADITGFTSLTDRLAQRGPAGAEEVSRLLNAYFGQLIEIIAAHGGEVVKFAGDALLALWPAGDEPLETVTRRAAQCGLAVQEVLFDYAAGRDVRLSLRVGIGAGELAAVHIGGNRGRWEFLTTGAPLAQISSVKREAQPGDVIISPQAWAIVEPWFRARPLDSGSLRLESVDQALPPRRAQPPPLRSDMEAALRGYIPGAIRDRLSAGQTEWLAELRRVTVLFVNLPSVDNAAPRGLKQAQMIMRALQTVLYRYEASINQVSVDDTGANMVAALGLPPWAHEDDALRGVMAAVDMQTALRALGLRPAIGVSTGLVFCGLVGTETRREYTMVGDVVNVSARLMQSARDDIYCDAPTFQAAQAQFGFEALPAIRVKGKAEPLAIYRPLGPARAADRPRSALIGRAAEWGVLADELQRLAQGGERAVVMIEGEAGIGKSRLVDEALRRAPELGLTSLVGAGDAIEKNAPYHAWSAVFARLFGVEAVADAGERRARVLAQLRIDPRLAELAPLLNAVLPLDLPENDATLQLTGPARIDSTREMLLRCLALLPADAAPKLLVVEDAHWIDSASWALLLLAGQQLPAALIVVTARPPSDPPSEYARLLQLPGARRIRLEALPPDDTLALVCQRLNVASLPEPVIELIRDKAEGHPLFSEEVAYALRDAGLIQIVDGECRLAPGAGDLRRLAFPDTMQGVITSRIDRLTPPQQMTVKTASVIGRVFLYRILRDVHPIDSDRASLPDQLDALQRLNLTLLDTPEPDLAYIFKHAITQDVVYNLMLFAQRRQLHRAVAEWYERAQAGGRARYDQLLAHHWSLAGDDEKAADYLDRAGQLAMHNGANAEAKALFEQALRTLDRLPAASGRQRQLVNLAVNLGRVGAYLPSDNILDTLQRARAAAEALRDEALQAQVHGSIGAFHYVMGRLGDALESFNLCIGLAEKLGLEALLMQPYNVIGRAMAVAGDYARGQELLAKGIALAEKFHDPELLAGSLAFYATTFWFQGRRAEGAPHAERGLALAEEIHLPSRIAGNLMVMGFCYCFCGFFDEAVAHLERCLSIAEDRQFVQPLYIAYGCLGYLSLQRGDADRARRFLDDSLRLAEANKASAFVPMYQSYRAEVDLIDGDWQAAIDRARSAVAAAERTRQRTSLGEAQRILGKVLTRAQPPDWERAEQALRASIALQRKCNALPMIAISTFDLGKLYLDQRRSDEARAACREALGLFEALDMRWHFDEARRIFAGL